MRFESEKALEYRASMRWASKNPPQYPYWQGISELSAVAHHPSPKRRPFTELMHVSVNDLLAHVARSKLP